MKTKADFLFDILKRYMEDNTHAKSISIIPTGLIGWKSIVIQEAPFMDISLGNPVLGTHGYIRGSYFIIFYPQGKIEFIKPLLSILLMLIDNGFPFILMPYKGVDWIAWPLGQTLASDFPTDDPVKFIDLLKIERERSSCTMSKEALYNFRECVMNYISVLPKKIEIIPADMRVNPNHYKYSLQGDNYGQGNTST